MIKYAVLLVVSVHLAFSFAQATAIKEILTILREAQE